MNSPGLGVMINMLAGNQESMVIFKLAIGQKIKALGIVDNELVFEFENGFKMALYDDGQSCCESRYMNTDDDLTHFVGATLVNASTREVECGQLDCEVRECAFLIVETDRGSFTCANYVDHNGYYGGFYIKARRIE